MVACRHLVRIGNLGHVGRFDSVDGVRYPRAARVICRTVRGLEVGEVLSPSDECLGESDGALLRPVTVEDDLLLARLESRKNQAYRACADLLARTGETAVLMDVEHLFDGQALYFYFLGEVTPRLESLTSQLAEAYDAEVKFRQFAETLSEGCGPDCGSDAAEGCGSSGCGSCAVAAACGTRHR